MERINLQTHFIEKEYEKKVLESDMPDKGDKHTLSNTLEFLSGKSKFRRMVVDRKP